MLSPTIYLFLLFLSVPSATIAVSIPIGKIPSPRTTLVRIHTYSNPTTTSGCNLECRRAFCISVSQFLESVTCTSHRPCLSLVLQYQIQEKCLNWRPEVHTSSVTIGRPAKSKADATSRSKDGTDPDCLETPPRAEWVKPYVPVTEAHVWEVGDARLVPAAEQPAHGDDGISCIAVLRWVWFVSAVVALVYAWHSRDRKEKSKEVMDWRVRGKGEV